MESIVSSQYSQAPLQLHRPLYLSPESPPVVYMKTPSSGLLHGDEHKIDVCLLEGAQLELRTQAATLVYPGASKQSFIASLGKASKLIFQPHSLILASQAELTQRVDIHLSEGATLIYQEDWCVGRIAMGERWQFKSFDYGLNIWQNDHLIYRERWILTPASQTLESPFICSKYTHFRTAFSFGERETPESGRQSIGDTDKNPKQAGNLRSNCEAGQTPALPDPKQAGSGRSDAQRSKEKTWIMETPQGKIERIASHA
jgi:urease accessory protein UreH